jgi:hypothetical protein
MRVVALAAAALLGGCVERIISVRSEPPGATVYVDGEEAGLTPCDVKYVWYGTREIALEMKGRRTVRERVPLDPPWWQVFPLDFLTDVVIPFTITDRLELAYTLAPAGLTAPEIEEVRRNAAELREKSAPK